MKFSIITVCKNSEKTIENTILSVINQSYKNFEYIIIDGVSTDKTLDIIEKYRDKLAAVISEPDDGLYDAMNKGIQNSLGEYLFFLNSDDRFLNENILKTVCEKAENSKKELLYGDQVFINEKTGKISVRRHNKLNKIYLIKNTPCQPATFYRKDVFEKYGFFDTDLKIVSDHEWFLRTFLNHKISFSYLGFAITAFNSGGISSDELWEEKLNIERNKMFNMYFSASERRKFDFLSKNLRCFTTFPVIKNILNKFFKFELYSNPKK